MTVSRRCSIQLKGVSMTISSSLNASVAGLNANASRLAAISDNIANASTDGYRRVETSFDSLVIRGNSGNYAAGGVRSTTERLIDQGGSLVTTENPTDLAVRGRGFIPVAESSEIAVAQRQPADASDHHRLVPHRCGGRLVTASGLTLLGWPAGPDGTVPPSRAIPAMGWFPFRSMSTSSPASRPRRSPLASTFRRPKPRRARPARHRISRSSISTTSAGRKPSTPPSRRRFPQAARRISGP